MISETFDSTRKRNKKVIGVSACVVSLWSYFIFGHNHDFLGCRQAPKILYDSFLHISFLILYVVSHLSVIWTVQLLNQPNLYASSKMGSVQLTLRRIKFFVWFRLILITVWLFLVFYTNAEETVIPVYFTAFHLMIVLFTFLSIMYAVKEDNACLKSNERMRLGCDFYLFSFLEISTSSVFLAFNISDVHLCHDSYNVF